MKVFFLTNLPSPYRRNFFAELGQLCELTVIYERRSAADRDEKWVADAGKSYQEIFLDAKEIGADNSLSFEIVKYLRKEKYDRYVIGMYSTYTAMIAIEYLRLKKIPFWISTDGGFIADENKFKYSLKKHLISSASYWLSSGKTASDYLVHYGAREDRLFMYPFTSLSKRDIEDARPESKFAIQRLKRKNVSEQTFHLAMRGGIRAFLESQRGTWYLRLGSLFTGRVLTA